jgi:hypothetical protein
MAVDFQETTLRFETPAHHLSERIGRVRFDKRVLRATCVLGDVESGFSQGDRHLAQTSYRLEEMRISPLGSGGSEVSFRYRLELVDKGGRDDPIWGKIRVVVIAEVEDA